MSAAKESLFRIDVRSESPKIVGTSWWNDSVKEFGLSIGRREAIIGAAVLGVFAHSQILGFLAAGARSVGIGSDFERRRSLDVQRTYGWSLGSPDESLHFPSAAPVDAARLELLPFELTPQRADLRPFHVGTLFEVATTAPSLRAVDEPASVRIVHAIHPWPREELTYAMRVGTSAAQKFWNTPGICLVVDLPGHFAVAFAAGASSSFEPVFLFDNWPHPRGVVPAHQTLGAALTLQEDLVRAARARGQTGAPMFVLDRNRLNSYVDDATQFDNRYLAKMPPAKSLVALGLRQVVYVASTLPEADDLSEPFTEYAAAGLDVRSVIWTDLDPGATGPARFIPHVASQPTLLRKLDPSEIGRTAVAVEGGRVLGQTLWRNGSWNRVSTSSSSGGG